MGINFQPAGFYKDHEGIVHLEGDVKIPSKSGPLFTLPPGFRPAANTVQGFQPGEETVLIAGSGVNVSGLLTEGTVFAGGENEAVALSGITFRPGS
jgi:hypothetical protein